jgi:hypothetical protein
VTAPRSAEGPQTAETHEANRREHGVDATREGHIAGSVAQSLDRKIKRHERRGARRVDGEIGPLQSQPI